MDSDSEFEAGRISGRVEEQRRLETYFHNKLGPELTALAFSIETIRIQLEIDGHPAEPELRKVGNRLSEILAPIHQVILSGGSESQRTSHPGAAGRKAPVAREPALDE